METPESGDICRVCRCEATPERPLFHPCICTGSIKFIHQECLVQWLRYSKKEFCELCNYRFSFTPIYSPDMPKRIPLRLVLSGLLGTVGRAVKFWLHYTLVAVAWLGVVPLTACRIYRTLFTGSVATILSLPINVFSTENIMADIFQGCAVVTLTLLAFIGLVWLREQILHGGGPAWLEPEEGGHHVGGQDNHPLVPAAPQGVAGGPEGDEDAENLIQNLPEEPPAPEIMDPAQDIPGDGGGEGDQWNPMEWDRAAEELTWERLLGLDGSLVFLEHVFWVVSLNTLFILVFAFCPYHIGHFTMVGFKLKSGVVGVHFSGLLITMTGYCMIGICLVLLHSFSSVLRFRRSARALGLCYVVVKVALLLVAEILVFPVICGWWLDVCSLALFDASLKDRMASFTTAPWASCFIHWLIGMVYVFYFASFVILLREVLRPGVLWFLRNLNDPDFNPIQEMIHLSLARHIRRFCASLVMFGTSILVMLYMPARIIRMVLPSFLPYTTQSQESNVDELAMELLLLLVILPAVQDQNQGREWLKFLVRKWCGGVAFLLNLQSYMFGDQDPQPVPVEEAGEQNMVPANINQEEGVQGLGAAHQALLQREGPTGFQTFTKPSYFGARIAGLLVLMLASWLLMSLSAMVLPVWLGRRLFSLWVSEGNRVYELYTSATGLYLCLVLARASLMLATWVRQGWTALGHRLREWAKVAGRAVVAISLLMGLIPLLFGLLLELVVLTPVRVQLHQSPIYFLWQDWALGAMYTKITVALTFMGPDWWLKEAIEQLYQDGIRNLNLSRVVRSLVIPSATFLGLALSLPYLLSHGLAPLVVSSPAVLVLVQRRVYPALLAVTAVLAFFTAQTRQFRKLVEHIKNDRYLVGRRLVNYNHVDRNQQAAQEVAAPS